MRRLMCYPSVIAARRNCVTARAPASNQFSVLSLTQLSPNVWNWTGQSKFSFATSSASHESDFGRSLCNATRHLHRRTLNRLSGLGPACWLQRRHEPLSLLYKVNVQFNHNATSISNNDLYLFLGSKFARFHSSFVMCNFCSFICHKNVY